MNRLFITARVWALGLVSLGLSACGTLNTLGGGSSELSVSPRSAVLAAADRIEPVMREVTVLVATGVVADNVADDIAQYGPRVQRLAAAYFDGAEACTVVGGQLTKDPAGGRECERSTLRAIYDSLDGEILAWMIDTSARGDQNTAAIIAAARLVVSLVPRPVAEGPFPGYRDEPDVPLALFQARRAAVRATFETLLGAARAASGELTS